MGILNSDTFIVGRYYKCTDPVYIADNYYKCNKAYGKCYYLTVKIIAKLKYSLTIKSLCCNSEYTVGIGNPNYEEISVITLPESLAQQ